MKHTMTSQRIGLRGRQVKALVVARHDRRKQISKSLARWHIDSEICTSLPAVGERLKKTPVDLLVTDAGMSEPSVVEAIRKLKVHTILLTTDPPGPISQFLQDGVVSLSYDELEQDDPVQIIERRKPNSLGVPPADVPLARHVVLDLHDPETGRLDAKRIAAYLHIPLSSLAAVTGGSVAAIHKAPAGNSLQPALAPIARTISLLSEALRSKEHVQAWLNSPHPDLGGQIPIRLVLEGHADTVADMLDAALAGQPS